MNGGAVKIIKDVPTCGWCRSVKMIPIQARHPYQIVLLSFLVLSLPQPLSPGERRADNSRGIAQVIAFMGEAGLLKQPLPAADRFVELKYLLAAGVKAN